MVIWVKHFQTESMIEICSKGLIGAICIMPTFENRLKAH